MKVKLSSVVFGLIEDNAHYEVATERVIGYNYFEILGMVDELSDPNRYIKLPNYSDAHVRQQFLEINLIMKL